MLIIGTLVAIFPTAGEVMGGDRRRGTGGSGKAAAAAAALLAVAAALGAPAVAEAQDEGSSSLHAGTVMIDDPDERMLFERLLCMCGDCQRLTLANCGCGWAEDARAELRGQMARGASVQELQEGYRAQHGAKAISIPSDEGLGRAMWAVPITGGVLAIGGLVFVGMRWRRRGLAAAATQARSDEKRNAEPDSNEGEYDSRLDEELSRMEDR